MYCCLICCSCSCHTNNKYVTVDTSNSNRKSKNKLHELTITYIGVMGHVIAIKFLMTIPQLRHLKNNNVTIISKQAHNKINKHTQLANYSDTKQWLNYKKCKHSQVQLKMGIISH